jgi:hypothetical protein
MKCHEFVDAQVVGGGRPVESWAVVGRGYTVGTKSRCVIAGIVARYNKRLKLTVFH